MKTYYSIRVVKANSREEAVNKVIDQDFDEANDICDVVLTANEALKQIKLQKPEQNYIVEVPKEKRESSAFMHVNFIDGCIAYDDKIILYSRSGALNKARRFNGKAKLFKGTPNNKLHYKF